MLFRSKLSVWISQYSPLEQPRPHNFCSIAILGIFVADIVISCWTSVDASPPQLPTCILLGSGLVISCWTSAFRLAPGIFHPQRGTLGIFQPHPFDLIAIFVADIVISCWTSAFRLAPWIRDPHLAPSQLVQGGTQLTPPATLAAVLRGIFWPHPFDLIAIFVADIVISVLYVTVLGHGSICPIEVICSQLVYWSFDGQAGRYFCDDHPICTNLFELVDQLLVSEVTSAMTALIAIFARGTSSSRNCWNTVRAAVDLTLVGVPN